MEDVLVLALRIALSAVFLVSGIAKLRDLKGTREALAAFGVPASLVAPVAVGLPIIELATAALLLPASTALIGGILATMLLLVFTVAIAYNLRKGREPECNCFGAIAREPIGTQTLVRNAILLGMALVTTALSISGAEPSALAWLRDLTGAQAAELVLLLVIALGVSYLAINLRALAPALAGMQRSLTSLGTGLVPDTNPAPDPREDLEDLEHVGLPVGTAAPAFTLDGVYGETGTLESLRSGGNPVLLVFSSPNCNPCNALMPDIGRWQRELSDRLTVAVIGRGEAAANRAKSAEHGLRNVLLQQDGEVSLEYNVSATPVGVLIDPDGLIDSPFAAGSDAIRDLVTGFTASQKDALEPVALLEPTPVAIGAIDVNPGDADSEIGNQMPANGYLDHDDQDMDEPENVITDLGGNPVDVFELLTDNTVLLFWSPGCGHCTRMLEDLRAWEADPGDDAPVLIVISRGTEEENREQNIGSAVLLDQYFTLGRQFGAGGTPTAITVDRTGTPVGSPAVGGPFVIALLTGTEPPELPAPPPPPEERKAGEAAPYFELNDLDGKSLALKELRGQKTFLLFWSPGCVHCQRMVDDLRAWEEDPPEDAPRLVVITRGDTEANKAAGLNAPILMDDDFAIGMAYGATATPSGYLVDESGMLETNLLKGAASAFNTLRYVSTACKECLDSCAQQGGGEACRMVCQMSGQCY